MHQPDDDDDLELLPKRRHHTTGISDMQSPMTCAQVDKLHKVTAMEIVRTKPLFKLDPSENKLYSMIYFFPHPVAVSGWKLPMVQRDEWHATLVVGYPAYIETPLTDNQMRMMDRAGTQIFNVMAHWIERDLDGFFLMPLSMPPWKGSWAFGYADGPFRNALVAVRGAMESLYDELGIPIRKQRELHVSWR